MINPCTNIQQAIAIKRGYNVGLVTILFPARRETSFNPHVAHEQRSREWQTMLTSYTSQKLDDEHRKDAIPVPVFTFWHWPFSPVKVNCPDWSPAGQPPWTNIVTQWSPEPPSTYMPRKPDIYHHRGGRLTRKECRPSNWWHEPSQGTLSPTAPSHELPLNAVIPPRTPNGVNTAATNVSVIENRMVEVWEKLSTERA